MFKQKEQYQAEINQIRREVQQTRDLTEKFMKKMVAAQDPNTPDLFSVPQWEPQLHHCPPQAGYQSSGMQRGVEADPVEGARDSLEI